MIYYIIFGILAFFAFLEAFTNEGAVNGKIKKTIVFLIAILLILLTGFRDESVGIDTKSYSNMFHLFKNGKLKISKLAVEPGYGLLNSISPTFRFLLVTMAFLSICSRIKAYSRISNASVIIALFFYYCTDFLYYDMGIIRQGLSMSICLLSIPLIVKRNKHFFLYVIVASLFHITAILFIALWFMSNKEFSRKFYYVCVLIAVFFSLGNATYLNLLIKIVNAIGGNYIANKFNTYLTYGDSNLTLSVLRRVLLLIVFIEMFKRKGISFGSISFPKRNSSELTWLYINAFFLSVVSFCILSAFFSALAGRMTVMFYTFYIFVYCEIFSDRRQGGFNLIWFILFGILAFDTFYGTINGSVSNYIPYVLGGF